MSLIPQRADAAETIEGELNAHFKGAAEELAGATIDLDAQIDKLAATALAIKAERDALAAVLADIVHEFAETYEGECDGGRWTHAASISVDTMQRAAALTRSIAAENSGSPQRGET